MVTNIRDIAALYVEGCNGLRTSSLFVRAFTSMRAVTFCESSHRPPPPRRAAAPEPQRRGAALALRATPRCCSGCDSLSNSDSGSKSARSLQVQVESGTVTVCALALPRDAQGIEEGTGGV